MLTLSSFVRSAQALGIVNAPNPTGFNSPNDIVLQACNAATWIFAAAIILSIVFVLLAAITYMRSSGDPGKVHDATQQLIYAAVGVAVALIAFAFPQLIATMLNVVSLGKVC